MGVLNYAGPLSGENAPFILVSMEDHSMPDEDLAHDDDTLPIRSRRSGYRKRACQSRIYDFYEYGVDERRSGYRHERRKQHMSELVSLAGGCSIEDNMTDDGKNVSLFAELFASESKMVAWQKFTDLCEDDQKKYLSEGESRKYRRLMEDDLQSSGLSNFFMMDKKIRDTLCSKHLAEELILYYENDVISCMQDCVSSVLVLQEDSSFHRLILHGLCQYMQLISTTVKVCDTSFIEIEAGLADGFNWCPPSLRLSKLLSRK